MVNREPRPTGAGHTHNYNILNIVVNTELSISYEAFADNYNILNIVVNTEHTSNYIF